jgi:hypothetical protein
MQQPWGTDPELRDKLVCRFIEWAGNRRAPIEYVQDAIIALDWSSDGRDGRFRWTVAGVSSYLLDYLPQRLSLPAPVCAGAAVTLSPLLDFLADCGLLSPDSDLSADLTKECADVWAAARRRMRDDVQVKALFQHVRATDANLTDDELIGRLRTLPVEEAIEVLAEAERRTVGPLRLPSEREQWFAAERAPVAAWFTRLREACGKGGLPLTAKGQLPDEQATALDVDAEDLPELLAWALAVGAVRRLRGQLVKVAAWSKVERFPVEVTRRALFHHPGVPERLVELAIELVVAAIALRWVDLPAFVEEFGDIREAAGLLVECGLMEIRDNDGRLTACGVPVVAQLTEGRGLLVRVLPVPEYATADELIDGLPAAGDEWMDDLREWALERTDRQAVREMVARLGSPPRPSAVVTLGLGACGEVFGDAVTVPPVRLLLGGHHDGPALLWLLRHGALDDGDVPADRVATANVVELAGLYDFGGAHAMLPALAEQGATTDQVDFLHLMWRSDHPRTCDVLLAIAEHCPDEVVASQARQLAERHRGWHARG